MTTVLLPTEPAAPTAAPRRRLRKWAWIVLFALAGGLLGAALGVRLDTPIEAQVSMVVAPLPGNAFSERVGNTLVDLETEGQLTVSDAVLRRVAQSGGPTVDSVRRRLNVRVVDNAEVLVLRYRGTSPEEAAATVERVAEATLAERRDRALVALNTRRALLEEQVATAEAAWEKAVSSSVTPERLILLATRTSRLRADLAALPVEAPPAGSVISVNATAGDPRNKARLGLVLGCAAGAALIGAWVGASPGTRRRRQVPLDEGEQAAG